jgi:hypothetical protein
MGITNIFLCDSLFLTNAMDHASLGDWYLFLILSYSECSFCIIFSKPNISLHSVSVNNVISIQAHGTVTVQRWECLPLFGRCKWAPGHKAMWTVGQTLPLHEPLSRPFAQCITGLHASSTFLFYSMSVFFLLHYICKRSLFLFVQSNSYTAN